MANQLISLFLIKVRLQYKSLEESSEEENFEQKVMSGIRKYFIGLYPSSTCCSINFDKTGVDVEIISTEKLDPAIIYDQSTLENINEELQCGVMVNSIRLEKFSKKLKIPLDEYVSKIKLTGNFVSISQYL